MKLSKILLMGVSLMLLTLPALAQDVNIEVKRLSDRVLLLTEDSPMANNVAAINTQKGVVVVDSATSVFTAKKMRQIIEQEFETDRIAYLINTHHHWDHTRGNQVFDDAIIVGHQLNKTLMLRDGADNKARLSKRLDYLKGQKEKLASMDPESHETKKLKHKLAFSIRNYKSDKEYFKTTPPTLTFSDRLDLDLGDVTLKMIYFGKAHSGCDILTVVPEEGLVFTGDLFLDEGWTPLFSGLVELDVPQFITALDFALDKKFKVKTVMTGHKKLWPREKLVMWRDYIANLWTAAKKAKKAGMSAEVLARKFPLEEKYWYLADLGHTKSDIKRFHKKNVAAFLRQLTPSTADMFEKALVNGGVDGAKAMFEKMMAKNMAVDENQFNALGYKLMNLGKLKEALLVFKINVKTHPKSWNVYDSLAEAYMNAGDNEKAIELYKKSLALNPKNTNGEKMLQKLAQ